TDPSLAFVTVDSGPDFFRVANQVQVALVCLLPPKRRRLLAVALFPNLIDHECPVKNLDCEPLLLVSLTRRLITVGPLLKTDRSVCFACLHYWAKTAAWEGWTGKVMQQKHI